MRKVACIKACWLYLNFYAFYKSKINRSLTYSAGIVLQFSLLSIMAVFIINEFYQNVF